MRAEARRSPSSTMGTVLSATSRERKPRSGFARAPVAVRLKDAAEKSGPESAKIGVGRHGASCARGGRTTRDQAGRARDRGRKGAGIALRPRRVRAPLVRSTAGRADSRRVRALRRPRRCDARVNAADSRRRRAGTAVQCADGMRGFSGAWRRRRALGRGSGSARWARGAHRPGLPGQNAESPRVAQARSLGLSGEKIPAASYSPTRLPVQYHRLRRA